jgi:hypothetical protein
MATLQLFVRSFDVIYNSEVHMLNRISLQYAPNANERFTRTIRKTHDARNERTIHERTNEMKRTNYTENGNKRTHDTRNERTIPETNARITIHERTNHWSVATYTIQHMYFRIVYYNDKTTHLAFIKNYQ